ncbi:MULTISPECIES: hypothetical protein [Nitrosomonas]|uniref:hypothetical protein n=1 Tax=Nitrosomonas TaxID=914 RepID=UPI0011874C4C|nr:MULTISPECIES: hypothetical protein [Nitrosomonas]UVS60211.1 hypothetical protein NX761_11870 [Nitrosomonas sp. PLL12]
MTPCISSITLSSPRITGAMTLTMQTQINAQYPVVVMAARLSSIYLFRHHDATRLTSSSVIAPHSFGHKLGYASFAPHSFVVMSFMQTRGSYLA